MIEPHKDTRESLSDLSKLESRNIGCAFILLGWLLVIGIAGAIFLGWQFGPQLIPGFYSWVESHPFLIGIIPGSIVGTFGILVGIWAPAIYIDAQANAQYPGAGAGATLGAMLLGTPIAFLLGPLVGAIGGLVIGMIGNRFLGKSRLLFSIYGAVGGGIAGLVLALIMISYLNSEFGF